MRINAVLDRADAGMIDAIAAAHVLSIASPAGTYVKKECGSAALTMTDRGGQWDARIEAGGTQRGGATAADCNVIGTGRVFGDRFEGQVVRLFGACDSETKVGRLRAIGVDVSRHDARRRTP